MVWENNPDLEINLGYHWIDRDTREPVMWDNGRRLHIQQLEPGQELEQDIMVYSPEEPGRYVLQYDLVHERVSWFSAEGVTPLEINVDVGQTVDKSIAAETRIFIANGNGISGVASRMSSYLRVYGFKISEMANADSFNYEKTVIYYTQENKEQADQVALVLDSYEKIQIQQDKFESEYGADSDIAIVVGQDYLDNIN